MGDAGEKVKRVVKGAGALAVMVTAHIDEEHGEVDRFELLGAPVFKRTPEGKPVVLGVTFPRWIRGPRRA